MFWLFAGAVLVADRLLKLYIDRHFALHESHTVIEGVLSLLYVRNEGAAFSLLSGQRWLLLMVAGITVCGILWYRRRTHLKPAVDIALGCVVGGAFGNMIDRVMQGYVIDYISVGWWPVFNLADMAIVSGGIWLFICVVRQDRAKTEEETHEPE